MEIVRGDTKELCFQRKAKGGEPILEQADSVYFTVKRPSLPDEFEFQKTLADMTFDTEGYYHFRIEPEDTDNLKFMEYKYDLEVIAGGRKKTIARGTLEVLEECTFVTNEV